ncbi:MAG: response regulator transcription factor [Oceanococcaceae bacterium]
MTRLRTVLVDDHADFRRLAQVLLSELPDVELVAMGGNGEEAVRLCEQYRPELLLCDIAMPRMGGIQATRLVKAQDHPPIVALISVYGDAEHRSHAQSAGADHFINKVDFLPAVVDLVAQLTEQHHA